MGIHRSISGAIVGIVVCGVVSRGLAAQTPSSQKRETPVFGAGVTLVAVPVFVTDKSGKGVGGLTAADFEVEDGGKKVPIVAFQAIDVDAPANAEVQPGTPGVSDLPLAVQAAATRQFMLLIDARFSPRKGLDLAKRAAAAYVRASLAPGDLVAVATTGDAGLRVLTNFTHDHDYVANIIADLSLGAVPSSDPLGFSSSGPAGGLGSMMSGAGMGGGMSAAGGGGNAVDAELDAMDALMAKADRLAIQNAAYGFLGDLETLVGKLAPVRGRKQVVLFSGGFSEGLWLSPDPDAMALRNRTLEACREAGRADVVIHTVDLNGITEAIDLVSQTGPNGGLYAKGWGTGVVHSGR